MLEDLAQLVSVRYQSAVTAHGDVGVERQAFENHLKRIIYRRFGSHQVENEVLLNFVQALHTDDLMLTLACAQGSDVAWQRFTDLFRKYVADLSRHLSGQGLDAHELSEAIWVDLFLPDRSGESRIASYDGRSSLATWLRVVVSNRMINERLRKGSCLNNLEGIPEPADPSALKALEAHLGLNRYRSMILWCFERASQCLTPKERLIVLLRYEQDLQLGEIAEVFSVHQSTITRQIDRATNRLRSEVTRLLALEYGLNQPAIDECLSVAFETLSTSASIMKLLKSSAPHDPSSEVSYSVEVSDTI